MPLRLIRKDEFREIDMSGTTFRLRRLTHADMVELNRKYTTRGKLDVDAHYRALWERILVGWTGLLNGDGTPLLFRPELVWDVVRGLPDDVAEVLFMKAKEAEVELNGALGNSEPS